MVMPWNRCAMKLDLLYLLRKIPPLIPCHDIFRWCVHGHGRLCGSQKPSRVIKHQTNPKVHCRRSNGTSEETCRADTNAYYAVPICLLGMQGHRSLQRPYGTRSAGLSDEQEVLRTHPQVRSTTVWHGRSRKRASMGSAEHPNVALARAQRDEPRRF